MVARSWVGKAAKRTDSARQAVRKLASHWLILILFVWAKRAVKWCQSSREMP